MGVWCVSPPTDFTDLHRWLGCVCSPTEFTEFTEVLLCRYSHGIHRIHRSFIASVLPRNSQNSQKFCCVGPPTEFTEFTEVWGCCWLRGYGRMPYPPNLCASVRIRAHLWETLLCKKLLCVPWVLWEYSLPRITQICTDGLVASVLPRNSQKFWGAVGSVGTAGCHTLLICAHPCYLWETLLCKKLLCVPWVLWEYSLPRISQINTDGWLR